MPAPKICVEYITIKGNEIVKRIQMLEDHKGYSIIEQERVKNRFFKVGQFEYRWDTIFFLSDLTRDIARTNLMGRLAMDAYAEGNVSV